MADFRTWPSQQTHFCWMIPPLRKRKIKKKWGHFSDVFVSELEILLSPSSCPTTKQKTISFDLFLIWGTKWSKNKGMRDRVIHSFFFFLSFIKYLQNTSNISGTEFNSELKGESKDLITTWFTLNLWHWRNYWSLYTSIAYCCSVAKSCPTLCAPMDCSMPGLPVPHHLSDSAQIHVHCISERERDSSIVYLTKKSEKVLANKF